MIRHAALATLIAVPVFAGECEVVAPRPEVEVGGSVPACYEMAVEAGQRVRVQVIEGDDAVFALEGIAEAQEDYAFVAEHGPIRLDVVSGAGGPSPFVLRVAVSDARPDAPGRWRVEEDEDRASGLTWIAEPGGPSFTLSCAGGAPRPVLTYDGLGTAMLTRLDRPLAPGALEIEVEGEVRRHPVTLERFDGFDRFWEVTAGLDGAALDDFASGSVLRLVDAEGSVAGRVTLEGSAAVREAIARRCGL